MSVYCWMFWALTCTSTPLLLFWHCTLNLWSVWRSERTMCMQISSSHYAGCLCMSAFFPKRCRWRVGGGMEWRCMFLERDLCTHTHTHPSVPPNLFRREKLYLHLHKNNWHFKLAFQSKRILFFFCSICAGTEHCHTGEYEREGKRECGWEGTRHKRLTLSSPRLRVEDLMCLFYCKYNLIYSKTDICRRIINDFFFKSRIPVTTWWGKMSFFPPIDRYLPLKAIGVLTVHVYRSVFTSVALGAGQEWVLLSRAC